MQNKNFLKELVEKLGTALPPQLQYLQKDLETNFHIILQNGLNKLDLVTRAEFDAQVKVLARSRKKIDSLEAKIKELERILTNEK